MKEERWKTTKKINEKENKWMSKWKKTDGKMIRDKNNEKVQLKWDEETIKDTERKKPTMVTMENKGKKQKPASKTHKISKVSNDKYTCN